MILNNRWLLGACGALLLAGLGFLAYRALSEKSDAERSKAQSSATTSGGATRIGDGPRAPRRGGSKGAVELPDEPSDEAKAWLAELEAAINENNRLKVDFLLMKRPDFLGYALPMCRRILADGQTPQRVLVALVLSRMSDDESLELLRSLLVATEPWEMKKAVIDALTERKDAESAEKILAFALDKTEEKAVRLAALNAMKFIGKKEFAERILALFLDDEEDKEIRNAALAALGAIKNAEVVPALTKAYKEGGLKQGMRLQLIGMLGMIGSEEALDLLIDVVREEGAESLRKEALYALMMIGGDKAIQALIELSDAAGQEGIRFAGNHALARTGDPKAGEVLRQRIDLYWDDKDLRGLIAQGLFYIADEESVAKGLDAMKRDPDMNGEYFSRINKKEPSAEVVKKLGEAYGDLTGSQRKSLVEALGNVKGKGADVAREELRKRLESENDAGMQQSLSYALAQQGDRQAIPGLERVYRYATDYDARDAAILAVGTIGGPDAEKFLEDVVAHETNYGLRMAAEGWLNTVRARLRAEQEGAGR